MTTTTTGDNGDADDAGNDDDDDGSTGARRDRREDFQAFNRHQRARARTSVLCVVVRGPWHTMGGVVAQGGCGMMGMTMRMWGEYRRS